MSKKTTKTAHVMSILTKNNAADNIDFQNDEATDNSAENFFLEQESDNKISQAVQSGLTELLDEEDIATAKTVNAAADSRVPTLQGNPSQGNPSQGNPSQGNASPSKIADSVKMPAPSVAPNTPTASPLNNLPQKSPVSDNYMVIPEISEKPTFGAPPSQDCVTDYNNDSPSPTSFDLLTNIKEFTPELFFDPDDNDQFPESYFTEKEKLKMTNYEVTKIHSVNEDYICVNVVEEITSAMLTDVMERFGLCQCDKCKADVMAIALNDLTPKYVGTYKGQLYVKLAGYEKQYSTDVLSALTKACIHVKSNPRHNETKVTE